ncbi:MAG: bifunctional UDP-3-O-[3-hydroxymyristoyl] N-acetylglucosamine deacetylase/3-hydroxyacyl-ACP dehydratase [Candidatus Omnitrophica bacterium]|nr:bifunctional UDP-3-O-[3-hydroxymyristoyl] N-acetylglucosamine deacetylase/3-hydroxyacyl-ACP dehydratase [Candidatus Omnitrophota bacterium]
MSSRHQKTIAQETTLSGVGLHTGNEVTITLKPAPVNSGIRFQRIDLPLKPVIKADWENLCPDAKIPRCTTIGRGEGVVHTIEHLMSALAGSGITNLHVDINGNELPGCDGSAQGFLDALKAAGIQTQDAEQDTFNVTKPVGVSQNGSSIFISPADDLRISYVLDYRHPLLHSQFREFVIDEETYGQQIAPSRTFCLQREAEELINQGLGKGANYQNTLVVGENGVLENNVRFEDEFVRHKILDIIGDLYLLGAPLKGHIFAVKSGHELNARLVRKMAAQLKAQQARSERTDLDFSGFREFDIQAIQQVLPHRYPFLLVDRVVEIEHGKRALGIKNVTINDGFFQGHFPTRPVMPGVLMVEAMAQTGGVVVLTNPAHRGKLAFFMAANNVKFRKVVTPGDQLLMEVEVLKDKSRVAEIHAVSRVDGEIVAEADMTFFFTDATYLE